MTRSDWLWVLSKAAGAAVLYVAAQALFAEWTTADWWWTAAVAFAVAAIGWGQVRRAHELRSDAG